MSNSNQCVESKNILEIEGGWCLVFKNSDGNMDAIFGPRRFDIGNSIFLEKLKSRFSFEKVINLERKKLEISLVLNIQLLTPKAGILYYQYRRERNLEGNPFEEFSNQFVAAIENDYLEDSLTINVFKATVSLNEILEECFTSNQIKFSINSFNIKSVD